LILVSGDNATIHDLTLDGNNPAITSGVLSGGVDVEARNGIITDHNSGTYNNLDVHNVTVRNIYLRGIYASSGGTFNFHDNLVQNVQGDPAASVAIFNFGGSGVIAGNTVSDAFDAIAANWSTGTTFQNNIVTASGSGVHSDNNGGLGGIADTLQGNVVSAMQPGAYGVWVFAPYVNAQVVGNLISDCAVGLASAGQSVAATPVFLSNSVSAGAGVGSIGAFETTSLFGFGSSAVSSSFQGNNIQGTTYGVYLQAEAGFDLAGTLSANNSVMNNQYGVFASGGLARTKIENNDLRNNSVAAIHSDTGATVDAGNCTVTDVTGLGQSAGGNNLTGYGFDGAAPWAVENSNGGGTPAVLAYLNPFGAVLGDNLGSLFAGNVLASQSGGLLITCLPPANVQCLGSVPAPQTTLAGFLAAGGTASATVASVGSADTFVSSSVNDRVITRHYLLTDPCGQNAGCDQIITVDDTIAPVVTAWPPDRTLSVNGQCLIAVPDLSGEVSATDNCGTVHISQNPVAGTFVSLGTTNVVVTVSDDGGNSVPHTTVLTIVDTSPAPLATYVDDDYTGLPSGTVVKFPFSGSGADHYIGCDAFATINAGFARVASGGTVNVASGIYSEELNINKSVTLLGAGAGGAIVIGPIGGNTSVFQISANGVVLDGFTITRDGNTFAQWNGPLKNAGVAIQGQAITGAIIRNCVLTALRTGIDINNSNGHTIRNNEIRNNRTGLIMRNQTDNLTVTENKITGNWTVGVLFLDGSGLSNVPQQSAANCSFFNNDISGNWYGQVVDRQAGGSIPAPGTNLKNFSGNWFGTANPVITTANSTEPGYAGLIPTLYGGTAVPPGGQPDLAGPASGNIDYNPWLDVGTDTSPTIGFQGDFSTLHVSAASPQVGATGRIQEGVNLVSGSTVLIAAGSYSENVVLPNKVTIIGAGSGGNPAADTIVTAANAAQPVFLSSGTGGTAAGDRLTIKNLRVLNGSAGISLAPSTAAGSWYRIENVTALGHSTAGIHLNGVFGLSQVQVANCVLDSNSTGLRVATSLPSLNVLEVTGGEMKTNSAIGLSINPGGTDLTDPATAFDNVSVDGTAFAANGSGAGTGDISLFRYNGNASIKNVSVLSAGESNPIQVRGKGGDFPPWQPAGVVQFQNVVVSGPSIRPGFYLVHYSDLSNVSFNNVDLSGVLPPLLPSGFASIMQVEHTGTTPLNLSGLKLKSGLTYSGNTITGGYGALAMLNSGGAIADCTTVILNATTAQQLEDSVYDRQDNPARGDVVFPALTVSCNAGNPAITNECTGGGANVTYAAPSAIVSCGPYTTDCQPPSGSFFPLGVTTVTCSVVDARGISNSCSFTVTVRDTMPPVLSGLPPSTASYQCYASVPPPPVVTASDICYGSLSVGYSENQSNPGSSCNNVITRQWSSTDGSGNVAAFTQTITVNDTTPPVLTAGSIAPGYATTALAEAAAIATTLATDNCGGFVTRTASTVGTCDAVVTVVGIDVCGNHSLPVTYHTRIDNVAPVIGAIAATEVQPNIVGAVNVKNCTNSAVQGTVNISVAASDNCLFPAAPTVNLTNGAVSGSAVFVNESPSGTFNYTWAIGPATNNGTWTVTVAANDYVTTTVTNFTICVDHGQIVGQLQLEGFDGGGTVPPHTRTVTFVATDGPGSGATVLKTWTIALSNVAGDTFNYTLTGVPPGTLGLSAKTAWNLRSKLGITLDINGQASGIDFAGPRRLRGGDLQGDNIVNFFDYSILGNNWFTTHPVADISGDGGVALDDYFVLSVNWFTAGDPQ
jgi:hypothetical protein